MAGPARHGSYDGAQGRTLRLIARCFLVTGYWLLVTVSYFLLARAEAWFTLK